MGVSVGVSGNPNPEESPPFNSHESLMHTVHDMSPHTLRGRQGLDVCFTTTISINKKTSHNHKSNNPTCSSTMSGQAATHVCTSEIR